MVDLADQFKSGSEAVKTPPVANVAPAVPATEKKADQATPELNVSFIKAGETGIVINPEPGKKSVFSRQVVTPTFKAPNPEK